MSISYFIRSYARDFHLLEHCLKSLRSRGARGGTLTWIGAESVQIVLAVPEADLGRLKVDLTGVKVCPVTPVTLNGYIDQQITKCYADQYCSGDFIVHLDSDCVLQENFFLPDFFVPEHGQEIPKLLFRRWEAAGEAIVWRGVTKSALIQEPMFEFMPAMPIVYHRSTHELFRRHIEHLHDRPFIKYVSRLAQFSEFNSIGNFCHLYTPDAYRFIRASDNDNFPRTVRQFWSHAPQTAREMAALV